MSTKKKYISVDGNTAAAMIGYALSDVACIFPITPSTEIPQMVSTFIANGEIDTEFIPVESEHSSMSATIGAEAAGADVQFINTVTMNIGQCRGCGACSKAPDGQIKCIIKDDTDEYVCMTTIMCGWPRFPIIIARPKHPDDWEIYRFFENS